MAFLQFSNVFHGHGKCPVEFHITLQLPKSWELEEACEGSRVELGFQIWTFGAGERGPFQMKENKVKVITILGLCLSNLGDPIMEKQAKGTFSFRSYNFSPNCCKNENKFQIKYSCTPNIC